MKIRIHSFCIILVTSFFAVGNSSLAQTAIVCAGAGTLNNGSVVTLGQPFVGVSRSADNVATLSVGLLQLLQPRTPMTNQFTINPSVKILNGRFNLGFYLEPGRIWIVDASTNLVDWSPVWADTATEPWVEFEDFTSFLFPRRFYRVRLQ